MVRFDISVHSPAFWWRASADDAKGLVPIDPDVADHGGRHRHADRAQQDWALIADVVAEVGDALAARAWTVDDGYWLTVVMDAPDLTESETGIVRSWFGHSQAVRCDPWDDIENGRHRLFNTREHFGGKCIPIAGAALGYADPANRIWRARTLSVA